MISRRWQSAGSPLRGEPILASHKELAMTSLTGTATLRRRLLGLLTATGLGGATAVVLLSAPSAVGASDPCAASEMARTISNVARSAGDYLDGHPETNQAMTAVIAAAGGIAVVRLAESLFRCESQGCQRHADHRAAAGGPGEQVPDAADQPSPGARLHAVRAGWLARSRRSQRRPSPELRERCRKAARRRCRASAPASALSDSPLARR